jgi:hypothetical protein
MGTSMKIKGIRERAFHNPYFTVIHNLRIGIWKYQAQLLK